VGVTRIGRLLRAVLLLYAASVAVVMLVQIAWPRPQAEPEPADAIFCLGAGMADEVSPLPDEVSRSRAQTCTALHARGVAPVVVFTGAGNDDHSAAQAMATTAVDAGLPAEAVIVEPRAHSTLQNAAFGLALLQAPPEHVILVSDAFHLPRAWVIFSLLGTADLGLYATESDFEAPLSTRLKWSLREGAAIWFNVGRVAVYGIAGLAGVDRETRISWFN